MKCLKKLNIPALLLPLIVLLGGGSLSTTVVAQEGARTLDELLELVQRGRVREDRLAKEREAKFIANKAAQVEALKKANELRDQEKARAERLEREFLANKELLVAKRKALQEAKGELTELFGHINSAAGDLRDTAEVSLVSIQYPNREEFLTNLIEKLKGVSLPEIEEIEQLWFEFQREIAESGRVVSFETDYATAAGGQTSGNVVRVGTFNVVADNGNYLSYEVSAGGNAVLSELPKQPQGKFVSWAQQLASSSDGSHRFGVDPTGPTGGSLLKAFIDSPTLVQRWHQGGIVGYVITGVGVIGILIAIWRFLVLMVTGSKVKSQLKSQKAMTNNPLGRVLAVHEESPNMDNETLELKLNEAVLKEIPSIENSLTLIKIISAVAPLLGLLGTVTGMIITFQAITIFGAGDPKTMAGGISSALVTTVLGLVVAIPTLLAHTVVNGRAKRIIQILEEQAAGIIARNAEDH